MLRFVRLWADSAYDRAEFRSRQWSRRLLTDLARPPVLDLGCGDGSRTLELIPSELHGRAYGADIDPYLIARLPSRFAGGYRLNLDQDLPFRDECWGTVILNQVVEHVSRPERLIEEVRRVTQLGGIVMIATENCASWDNILATILGWQPFSSTNFSAVNCGVGNPLAKKGPGLPEPMHHRLLFSYRGLKDFLELHGCEVLQVVGAGYFPFPACLGSMDPRHARFISAICRKIT